MIPHEWHAVGVLSPTAERNSNLHASQTAKHSVSTLIGLNGFVAVLCLTPLKELAIYLTFGEEEGILLPHTSVVLL